MNTEEHKQVFQAGFQKLHDALNIKKYMPVEYYDGVKRYFLNESPELFVYVISKLVLEYREWQMPPAQTFRTMIAEAKKDVPQFRPKQAFLENKAPEKSEKEEGCAALRDWVERNKKEKEISTGAQRVKDRHNRIRVLLASGKVYCEVLHKWVSREEAKKIKVWEFLKNKSNVDFASGARRATK